MNELKCWYRRHRGKNVVLFEDETYLLLFPPLRSAWARRGKPNRFWLSGHNAKKVIFSSINLKTGHHIEMEQPDPLPAGRSALTDSFAIPFSSAAVYFLKAKFQISF
ncbi:MAG TPA: hypothetical protein VIG33_08860 [Pseudobdellovibrionaceae bacterium]